MRFLIFFSLLIGLKVTAQQTVVAKLIESRPVAEEQLVALDNFGNTYTIAGKTLTKQTNIATYNYSNVQLGFISQVDVFNPLKIPLFYNTFNTVVVLDNRLAEIYKVDFNTFSPYKYVTHISTGNDNTIWIYNLDNQQLELFDYKSRKTRLTTMPLQGQVLDIDSDYNHCWLLTEDYLYQFHYTGSIIQKTKNTGYDGLCQSQGNLYLKKGNQLFVQRKNNSEIKPIDIPDLLIKHFFLTNETLYIYQEHSLNIYQLKIQ